MICSERVTLLPLEPGDAIRLREIPATPAVSRWWEPPEPVLPDDEPETMRFAMLDGEELAGMIHCGEENTPEYSHAKVDYSSARRRRGLGPEAIEALVAHLLKERGHYRIPIDPALANEAAILAYEKAGFRRVGVIEAYWLDHVTGDWSDGFLMERVIRSWRQGIGSGPQSSRSASRRSAWSLASANASRASWSGRLPSIRALGSRFSAGRLYEARG